MHAGPRFDTGEGTGRDMRWDSWELGIADSNATFSSGSVQGLPVRLVPPVPSLSPVDTDAAPSLSCYAALCRSMLCHLPAFARWGEEEAEQTGHEIRPG